MKAQPKMTLQELVKRLKELSYEGADRECNHATADRLLVQFINKPSVSKAYDSIAKWYS